MTHKVIDKVEALKFTNVNYIRYMAFYNRFKLFKFSINKFNRFKHLSPVLIWVVAVPVVSAIICKNELFVKKWKFWKWSQKNS